MECFTKKKKSLWNTILDAWHGSEYTSGLHKLFCHGSQSDTPDCMTYAKLIIVFTPNLEFPPYSEVIHIKANKMLTTVKEKWLTIQFDVFNPSFIFFIAMSQTISFINRTEMWYFLHASN